MVSVAGFCRAPILHAGRAGSDHSQDMNRVLSVVVQSYSQRDEKEKDRRYEKAPSLKQRGRIDDWSYQRAGPIMSRLDSFS